MEKYFNKVLGQYSCNKCYFISKKKHHFKNHMENGKHYLIPFAIKNLNRKRLNNKLKKYDVENDEDINFILNKFKNIEYKNFDIYEFGTYSGWSLKHIINILIQINCTINNINGFDSLLGLPNEILDKYNYTGWKEGEMSVKSKINVIDTNEYIDFLNLKKTINYKKFNFIKGFFNESLKKTIIQKYDLKPALFINIDCDIYSSTCDVLEFIFSNNLYVKGVTMIRYDDWGCFYENTKNYDGAYLSGEGRAHKELCEKYNINCKLISIFSSSQNKFGTVGCEEAWFIII